MLIAWHSQVASREHAQASGMEVFYKGIFTLSFSSSLIFSSCHPFISVPFTHSAEVQSPSKRDIKAKLAGIGKTRNIPHWPRATGNLPAPALGCEIKAVFEMSQKTLLLPHILHLWPFGNIDPPGVGDKKALTVTLSKRVYSHSQIMLALLLTIYEHYNEQRWSWSSLQLPYTKESRWDGEALACLFLLMAVLMTTYSVAQSKPPSIITR